MAIHLRSSIYNSLRWKCRYVFKHQKYKATVCGNGKLWCCDAQSFIYQNSQKFAYGLLLVWCRSHCRGNAPALSVCKHKKSLPMLLFVNEANDFRDYGSRIVTKTDEKCIVIKTYIYISKEPILVNIIHQYKQICFWTLASIYEKVTILQCLVYLCPLNTLN